MSRLVMSCLAAFILMSMWTSAWAAFPKTSIDRQKFAIFSNPIGKSQKACVETAKNALGMDSELGCYIGVNLVSLARFARGFGRHSEGPELGASFITLSFKF